jgi:hypothetical protein
MRAGENFFLRKFSTIPLTTFAHFARGMISKKVRSAGLAPNPGLSGLGILAYLVKALARTWACLYSERCKNHSHYAIIIITLFKALILTTYVHIPIYVRRKSRADVPYQRGAVKIAQIFPPNCQNGNDAEVHYIIPCKGFSAHGIT